MTESPFRSLHRVPVWARLPVAILAACALSTAVTVGVQLAVWGHSAPSWYLILVTVWSLAIGCPCGWYGAEWSTHE